MNRGNGLSKKEDRSGKKRTRSVERYFLFARRPPEAAAINDGDGSSGPSMFVFLEREREHLSLDFFLKKKRKKRNCKNK